MFHVSGREGTRRGRQATFPAPIPEAQRSREAAGRSRHTGPLDPKFGAWTLRLPQK